MVPGVMRKVRNSFAGATMANHTSPTMVLPQPGLGIPAVRVAPELVVVVVVQEVFTANAIAPHGLSLAGGGGGSHAQMLKVPVPPP